jgi:predicted TIM-barrel fold metal-dependent hydrolase
MIHAVWSVHRSRHGSKRLACRVAERHPGLRLTIDHLGGRGGTSTLKDAAAMIHMPALLALAKHPNVAVKATGVPHYSGEAYPFPALHPICGRSSMPSVRTACSGAPTSPRCRAPGINT